MKRTIVGILCGVALLGVMAPGAMAAKDPAKIRHGAKGGKQSKPELKQLKAQLKALRAEEKAAKANGKLSPEQKAKFKAERERLTREIAQENKEGQERK
jgi:hypothetical protein